MGLGMIEAMKIFDAQRHEGIKMRVGIHTGNVLCGIVGTKRVKFDVWSNDVTFANKMESTGNPDLVHISEETKKFLGDAYMFREAEEVDGHRTYFILGKKNMMNNENDEFTEGNVRLNAELQIQANKLKNLSTNDIPHMNILPTSPIQQSKSLSPSPILAVRKHRLASISGTVSKLLPFTTSSFNKNPERQPLDYLRSYISQSRCDVSPFTRNNSHRSHSDRYNHNHQRSNSQQSNSLTPWYREGSQVPDYASLSPSRKDSGVRSNSRRSSIQQQLYYKNVLTNQNRVSGYFTSSQSSLYGVEGAGIGGADSVMMKHLPVPSPTNMMDLESRNGEDALKACVIHLRKQSDLQLIKCVRDNARSQRSYLVKPPLKKFSLYFESDAMEQNFRNKAHRHETENETGLATLATPKVLSSIYNLLIILSLFLVIFAAFCNSVTWQLQLFWGKSADFWQLLWDKFIDFVGEDEFSLFVWGTTIFTFLVYWMFGAIYTLMDITNKPAFLRRYKIQPETNEPVETKRLIQVIMSVIFNQICVGIPFALVSYYAMKLRGISDIRELPKFHRVLLDLAVCILVEEFGFYYSHRLMHSKKIYKYIHKRHHEWTSPISITAIYCHPIEHIFSNVLPPFLGVFVCGSHIAIMWIWFALALLSTLNAHSGYHLPFFPSPEAHDFHHLKFNQNFGVMGVLDRLHGTDTLFRASSAFPRHIMLLSFLPARTQYPDGHKKTL
ncbi:unnamed protein product [Diamesa serratosioi]